jgi:hypothetical protein
MSTATNPSTSGTAAIGNPPDPVHSNVKVTHSLDKLALNAPLWENDVISVLVSKNVSIYVEEEHPGTKGDAVAKGVLTEKIPDSWALEAITKPNAKQMWDWIRSKYSDGTNQVLIDQQVQMLEQGTMTATQTVADHVELKTKVAVALRKNKQTISDGKLKSAIVSNLPHAFDAQKANLLGQILDKDSDTCVYRIKLTADLIGFDDTVPRRPSVNSLPHGPGSSGRGRQFQGRGRGYINDHSGPHCFYCKSHEHSKGGCELWRQEQQRRRNAEMEAQRPHVNPTGYTSANPTPSVNFTSLHIEDSD